MHSCVTNVNLTNDRALELKAPELVSKSINNVAQLRMCRWKVNLTVKVIPQSTSYNSTKCQCDPRAGFIALQCTCFSHIPPAGIIWCVQARSESNFTFNREVAFANSSLKVVAGGNSNTLCSAHLLTLQK